MEKKLFHFSKISKLIIGGAISLTIFSLIAIKIYENKERIAATFHTVVYAIKLPFNIYQLVAKPPDGALFMPVEDVLVKNVDDTWEEARSEGRTHEGQDIFAKRGTPVISATEGYVIRMGQNRLGGNIVFVLGAGGRRYYYAHLNDFAENINYFTKVNVGTVLGYVGNSGNAEKTPPHLHFGVYTKEGPINPLPLIKNDIME